MSVCCARGFQSEVSPRVSAVILVIAALESGCRVGELLGLRWRDVKWTQNVLLLPADLTRTAEDRDVP